MPERRSGRPLSRRDEQAEKAALVEAGFRIANDRMTLWPERHSGGREELYLCECSDLGCQAKIRLRRELYEAARAHPEHFILCPVTKLRTRTIPETTDTSRSLFINIIRESKREIVEVAPCGLRDRARLGLSRDRAKEKSANGLGRLESSPEPILPGIPDFEHSTGTAPNRPAAVALGHSHRSRRSGKPLLRRRLIALFVLARQNVAAARVRRSVLALDFGPVPTQSGNHQASCPRSGQFNIFPVRGAAVRDVSSPRLRVPARGRRRGERPPVQHLQRTARTFAGESPPRRIPWERATALWARRSRARGGDETWAGERDLRRHSGSSRPPGGELVYSSASPSCRAARVGRRGTVLAAECSWHAQ
jgi:hypothetical protein